MLYLSPERQVSDLPPAATAALLRLLHAAEEIVPCFAGSDLCRPQYLDLIRAVHDAQAEMSGCSATVLDIFGRVQQPDGTVQLSISVRLPRAAADADAISAGRPISLSSIPARRS